MSNPLFDQFPPTYSDPESEFEIDPSEFSGRILFDLKQLDCDEEDEVFFLCTYEMSECEWMMYDQHDDGADSLVDHIFSEEAADGRLTNAAEGMYGMRLKEGQTADECKKYIFEKLLAAGCLEVPALEIDEDE